MVKGSSLLKGFMKYFLKGKPSSIGHYFRAVDRIFSDPMFTQATVFHLVKLNRYLGQVPTLCYNQSSSW